MNRTDRDGGAVTATAVIGGGSAISAGIWHGALDLLGPDGRFRVQRSWRRDDLPGPALREAGTLQGGAARRRAQALRAGAPRAVGDR